MNKHLISNDEKAMDEILNSTKDLGTNIWESNIDAFLDPGLLKDIPIISTLISFYKTGVSIHDAIFMRKLTIFIHELKDLDERQKSKFWKIYQKDDKGFAGRIFEILDKIDDSEKCRLEANIFKHYYNGNIDIETFKKYSYSLLRIDMYDLNKGYTILQKNLNLEQKNEIILENGIGQAYLSVGMANIRTCWESCGFSFNEDGKKFLQCIFN